MSDRAMILIAEPEEAVRESIETVLIDEGYDCHAVNDTEALLRAIQIHNLDMIVADIQLIHADVKEILDVLRQYEPAPPPILVTLNYERIGDMLDLIRFGINEYLLKPFLFEEMTERIQKLLAPKPDIDSNQH